jgi:hypothetical protein
MMLIQGLFTALGAGGGIFLGMMFATTKGKARKRVGWAIAALVIFEGVGSYVLYGMLNS